MSLCKDRAFDVLKRISFERIAGTEKELECAHILKEECEKAGVEAVIEEFEIDTPEIFEAKFKVVTPTEKEFVCIGIGASGTTPDEGVVAPLCYVENGMDANLLDVKGKIVLLTGGEPNTVEKLVKAGAVGYIQVHGSLFDSEEVKTEIRTRNARKKPGDESNLPGVVIHICDAQELLRMGAEEVSITLKQDKDKKGLSHNVVATIPGTEKPEEIITFSAHFDSVIYSSGAWDNGTGSITIMELMHYFNANKPKRTLKFIWCGSEEIGLCGSRAYCEKHKDELDKTLFNINVDMTGTLLGFDIAVCSCEDSCAKYIDYLGKINGFAIKTSVDMYSSDSSSFACAGVPAVTFARLAPRGGAEIHSRRDIIDHLDPTKFIKTVEFMAQFSDGVVNAKVFPVSKEFPKELNEKIERFKKFAKKPEKKDEKVEAKEEEKK
jgi:hypothetical protein